MEGTIQQKECRKIHDTSAVLVNTMINAKAKLEKNGKKINHSEFEEALFKLQDQMVIIENLMLGAS